MELLHAASDRCRFTSGQLLSRRKMRWSRTMIREVNKEEKDKVGHQAGRGGGGGVEADEDEEKKKEKDEEDHHLLMH